MLDWIHWLKTAGWAGALAVGRLNTHLDATEWAVASPEGAIRATVKGHIGLQDHGPDCWFKHIKLLVGSRKSSGNGNTAGASY